VEKKRCGLVSYVLKNQQKHCEVRRAHALYSSQGLSEEHRTKTKRGEEEAAAGVIQSPFL